MREDRRDSIPKKRFRLMLGSLGVILFFTLVFLWTANDMRTVVESVLSLLSAVVTSIAFLINYGKDLVAWILNFVAKNSLR